MRDRDANVADDDERCGRCGGVETEVVDELVAEEGLEKERRLLREAKSEDVKVGEDVDV